jgi:hypothetical protein
MSRRCGRGKTSRVRHHRGGRTSHAPSCHRIIEAPAAIGASESLALAPLVDGIVVVADAMHTDHDEVEQVRIHSTRWVAEWSAPS